MGEGIMTQGVRTRRVRVVGGYKKRSSRQVRLLTRATRSDRDVYGDKSAELIRSLSQQEKAWNKEQSAIEKARAYELSGKQVYENDKGSSRSVYIPSYARMGNVTTHIHPKENSNDLSARIGTTFSKADIANAIQFGARETRAVAAGYTYSMRPNNPSSNLGLYDWGTTVRSFKTNHTKAINAARKTYGAWYAKQRDLAHSDYNSGKINKSQYETRLRTIGSRYNVMVQHKAMQSVAKRYGWKYTRTKTR